MVLLTSPLLLKLVSCYRLLADNNFALSPRFLKRQRSSVSNKKDRKVSQKGIESAEEEEGNTESEEKEATVAKELKPLNYIMFNVYRNLISYPRGMCGQ